MIARPLSASQIRTFLECQRKWAGKYLELFPDSGSASASFGKTVHVILAHYLETGELPIGDSKEEIVALAMIRELPIPESGMEIEKNFTFEHDGVTWRGTKDLTYIDADRKDSERGVDPIFVVHDHKTTGDARWIPTEEELARDPQKTIYALHEFLGSDIDSLRADWLYGSKKAGEEPVTVSIEVDRAETFTTMEALTKVGKRMLALYEERSAMNDLPPTGLDEGICYSYGRCPFLRVCDLTPNQRVRSLMRYHNKKEENLVTYKERLAARTKAQQEEITAPETPAPGLTLEEKVKGFGSDVSPPPFAPYKVLGPDTAADGSEPSPGVVDPDDALVELPKKSKGRPKGSKNKAKEIIEASFEPDGPTDPPPSFEPAGPPDSGVFKSHITVDMSPGWRWKLLVNVYPDQPYTPFSSYVLPVLWAVREATGLEDYRLVDYGKGAGIYVTALEQYIAKNPPAPPGGFLVVDVRTQEGRDALPTLERAAGLGNIFRGF